MLLMSEKKGPRPTRVVRIDHAETLPCPRGGTHTLVNREERTLCSKCRKTWTEIDRQMRVERGLSPTPSASPQTESP